MAKVTIVGSGNVGTASASYIAEKRVADVVLLDIVPGLAKSRAQDIMNAAPIRQYHTRVSGSENFAEMEGSDVVVVTAGKARTPGMTREDLLQVNLNVVRNVSREIARYAAEAILIPVTNPLDLMAFTAWKTSGFAASRVVGMAGVLDSTRFRTFLADALHVHAGEVNAMVLGGHGDSMVPLPRYTSVSGIPITELLPAAVIEKHVERTRNAGTEIVSPLKTGSAFWAPGASIAEMVECIILDKKRILPCSAYLEGEYGIEGVFIGVPVLLGRNGVEKILELSLSPEELNALEASAKSLNETIAATAELQ